MEPPLSSFGTAANSPLDFLMLASRVLHLASRGVSRIEFLREVSRMLLEFSRCDELELVLCGSVQYRWRASKQPKELYEFALGVDEAAESEMRQWHRQGATIEDLPGEATPETGVAPPTANRTLDHPQTRDSNRLLREKRIHLKVGPEETASIRSLLIAPFDINDTNWGLLKLWSTEPGLFGDQTVASYESVAHTLGLAIGDRRAQAALRERVKELTCLYGIARILDDTEGTMHERMAHLVRLLPPAWQFPDMAAAIILLDGQSFTSGHMGEIRHRKSANIVVGGVLRGRVEIGYAGERAEFAEGPFLPEEESLIQAVAREIATYIARHEAQEEKKRLSEQLRHADRLKTIGEFAAGAAHEINEPLGSILGFAQLARKAGDASDSLKRDLDKIVDAALKARDVVRQLLLFARRTPPNRISISLNQVARDGCSMLQMRCAHANIDVVQDLDETLPDVLADPIQLHQVLVNLMVNSIQAMPHGGTLTLTTWSDEGSVYLKVGDTGVGMTDEVIRQAFHPFYTTKGVGEGTGLGLPVAHGIVTAHGGDLSIESEINLGSRVTVQLPR